MKCLLGVAYPNITNPMSQMYKTTNVSGVIKIQMFQVYKNAMFQVYHLKCCSCSKSNVSDAAVGRPCAAVLTPGLGMAPPSFPAT